MAATGKPPPLSGSDGKGLGMGWPGCADGRQDSLKGVARASQAPRCPALNHCACRISRLQRSVAIYLFMSGAPPQMDMWDYKPGLASLYDKDLPDSDSRQPAADRHDSRPGTISRSLRRIGSSLSKENRDAGSATCFPRPARWSTTSLLSTHCIPTPSITSLQSC